LEQFIDSACFDPHELNLYEIENLWFSDSAKLGTAWTCVRPELRIEAVYSSYDEKSKRPEFENATLYKGPKVINPRFEDLVFDPNVNSPEESQLFGRKVRLKKRDIQERVWLGQYRAAEAKKILERPDRYGATENEKRENQRKGISDTQDRAMAEWD